MLMHWEVKHITHRNYAFEMNGLALMDNGSPQMEICLSSFPRGN